MTNDTKLMRINLGCGYMVAEPRDEIRKAKASVERRSGRIQLVQTKLNINCLFGKCNSHGNFLYSKSVS